MSARTARRIAWILVVGYALTAAVGITLQVLSPRRTYLGLSIPFFVVSGLFVLIWTSIGAFIVHRLPRHPVGWIMLLAMISFGPEMVSFGLLAYFPDLPRPLSDLSRTWLAWSGSPFTLLAFTLLFLLFPTGRPLSPGWGKLRWLAVLAFVGYLLLSPLSPENPETAGYGSPLAVSATAWNRIQPLWWAVLAAQFGSLAAASLVLRLRRSVGVERQQLKWFAFAAAFFPLHVPLIIYAAQTGLGSPALDWAIGLLLGPAVAMALATAVAILRYRLYDIDLIINRALVYGALSGSLALIYSLSVLGFQSLLRALTGQESQIAIVGSTLLVAASFQPLRRRVQEWIDRRFYRRKYDAAQLLNVFSLRLRDPMDSDELTAALMEVVEGSLQPAHMSLWLRRRQAGVQ